jgi:hypothetical protein
MPQNYKTFLSAICPKHRTALFHHPFEVVAGLRPWQADFMLATIEDVLHADGGH